MNTKETIKTISKLDNLKPDQKNDWQVILNFISDDLVFMDTFLLQNMLLEIQVEINSREHS